MKNARGRFKLRQVDLDSMIRGPNWCIPFVIMYDASDRVIDVVLGLGVWKENHMLKKP